MATSISSSIVACLKSFNEFIEEVRHRQEANVGGLVAGAWVDELGRLRMWAANIGAHQTGQSSLDFRLRDASHVRDQIIKLLQGLFRRLQDARDVLAEDEQSDDEESADDSMTEDDPKTEIQELQESIATTINCLFQMSMLVRKPVQHDVHIGSRQADVAAFEPFDYSHVREKYPRANDALVKRLGNAITRRRMYLKYRERHAVKLRQGIDNVDLGARGFQDIHDAETMKEGTTSFISDTVATNFQSENIRFDDNASDTGISQTSYAPTLLSGGNVAIPPPPKSSFGGMPFECPFCFYLITIHGTRSWSRHVFQDLQPYICMASTCATPDKLYPTRHEWLHHSNTAHRIATMDHGISSKSKESTVCPLCKDEVEFGKQYERHLARHLQELALFILPGCGEDSDSDIDDDWQDAESSLSSESIDLSASHDRPNSPDGSPALPVETSAVIDSLGSSHSKEVKDEEVRLLSRIEELGRQRGPDDPDTWASMTQLLLIYQDQGRLTEAEDLILQVTKARERVLGVEHPDTLNSMCNLAAIYQNQGRLNEAEGLTLHVTKARTRVLGPEHPDTLNSIGDLVLMYLKQGRSKEAEDWTIQVTKHVTKARTRVLGPEHPDTLNSIGDLASMYLNQGRLKEAEDLTLQVTKARERVSGAEDLSTLTSMGNLALIYEKEGRLTEAQQLLERVLVAKERVFGPDDILTLGTVSSLCSIYQKAGRLRETEDMYDRILKAAEEPHRPDHLNIATILGKLNEDQGRMTEAQTWRALYRRKTRP